MPPSCGRKGAFQTRVSNRAERRRRGVTEVGRPGWLAGWLSAWFSQFPNQRRLGGNTAHVECAAVPESGHWSALFGVRQHRCILGGEAGWSGGGAEQQGIRLQTLPGELRWGQLGRIPHRATVQLLHPSQTTTATQKSPFFFTKKKKKSFSGFTSAGRAV